MRVQSIFAYLDRMDARPGESVGVHVSNERPDDPVDIRLLRIRSADSNPWGRGVLTAPVNAIRPVVVKAEAQTTNIGSFFWHRFGADAPAALTITFLFQPTRLPDIEGCLVGLGQTTVTQDGTRHVAVDGSQHERGIAKLTWYRFVLSFDGAGRSAVLCVCPAGGDPGSPVIAALDLPPLAAGDLLSIGACPLVGGDASARPRASLCCDGKLEDVQIFVGASTAADCRDFALGRTPVDKACYARWSFARDFSSDRIVSTVEPPREAWLENLPTRSIRGARWDGSEIDRRRSPESYAAVHLHSDDLLDCRWPEATRLHLPADLESGIYAVRVANALDADLPILHVLPSGPTRNRIAFLAPTATYLAYANFRQIEYSPNYEISLGPILNYGPEDIALSLHPEWSGSTYHRHHDGSPILFSSCRRPMLNIRPESVLWTFTGDMFVPDWLDATGRTFDVITDEALDREGKDLLRGYSVVLTGAHPEYCSHRMFDALETWVNSGGRLMYLGGNGFDSSVTFHPDIPGVLERRWVGAGPCIVQAGEQIHALADVVGGELTESNRPRSRLVGSMLVAVAFDRCEPYARAEGASDPRAGFAFRDLQEGDVIGAYGAYGGGAAGLEIDAVIDDAVPPEDRIVLLSSFDHSMAYHASVKETDTDTAPPPCRSDVVLIRRPEGGAVFSVGSIAWPLALPWKGYDNDISRMTGNVLDRFLDPEPLW